MQRILVLLTLLAALASFSALLLAGDAYVGTTDARIVNQKARLGASTVESLKINDKVDVQEGEAGKCGWARVKTASGKEGYIDGSALRGKALEMSASQAQNADKKYSESVGAAAKGWNSQVESRACKDDAKYNQQVLKLNAYIKFLNDNLRIPNDKYVATLEGFYKAGGLAPGSFSDDVLNQ